MPKSISAEQLFFAVGGGAMEGPDDLPADRTYTASLRSELENSALSDDQISSLEKRINLNRALEETQKFQAERENNRRTAKSESTKFYISIAAPLISALVIAATLIFQIHQFTQNVENQRTERESTEFREALRTLQTERATHQIEGFVLLRTFLSSPTYHAQAREVGVSLLQNIVFLEAVRALLPEIVATTEWNNFSDLTLISSSMREFYASEDAKSEAPKGMSKPASYVTGAPNQLTPYKDYRLLDALDKQLTYVGEQIAGFLQGHARPKGQALDLTNVGFMNVDLSNVDLSGAVLEGTQISNTNLDGTNLTHAQKWESSYWAGTAWWKAKAISPDLLNYLKDKFPFSREGQYPKDPSASQMEYQDNLRRLSALSGA